MTTPTMNKMVKLYVESASVERLKCGKVHKRATINKPSFFKDGLFLLKNFAYITYRDNCSQKADGEIISKPR